jgi:hypothetical protein
LAGKRQDYVESIFRTALFVCRSVIINNMQKGSSRRAAATFAIFLHCCLKPLSLQQELLITAEVDEIVAFLHQLSGGSLIESHHFYQASFSGLQVVD